MSLNHWTIREVPPACISMFPTFTGISFMVFFSLFNSISSQRTSMKSGYLHFLVFQYEFSLPSLFSFSTFHFVKCPGQYSCKIFFKLVLQKLDSSYDCARELHRYLVFPTEFHWEERGHIMSLTSLLVMHCCSHNKIVSVRFFHSQCSDIFLHLINKNLWQSTRTW